MKRALICLVVTFCAINFAPADPTIRSLQQTLKDQGFYYGAVTGEKSAETSVNKAIRLFLRIQSGALRSITTGTLIVTRFHSTQCSYTKIGLALVTV